MTQLPIKHLSVRVPWHDSGWDGTVCKKPGNNASCLFLARISLKKDDAYEETIAGKHLSKCDEKKYPPCVAEKVNFMSDQELIREISHPYSETSELYKHFKPTSFRTPPFSFGAIPFRWMMKDSRTHKSEIAEARGIEYNVSFEPLLEFNPIWVQDARNQRNLLEAFSSAIVPEKSLVFIYAKHVPFYDKGDRVLIGVGRIKSKGKIKEYDYSHDGPTKSVIWDVPMQHSIRNDFQDGFLIPYQELMLELDKNPELDAEAFVAVAPHREEFSYGAEHVSHDSAIDSLLRLENALRGLGTLLSRNYDYQLRWIDDRLSELWNMRGPCPGLGPVLQAFGIEQGNFIAWEIFKKIESENSDILSVNPWDIVEKMFAKPESILPSHLSRKVGKILQGTWEKLPEERKAFLKLLSRMEINNDQAQKFYDDSLRRDDKIVCSDQEFNKNPYLFYELDRFSQEPITFNVVDKGIFPAEIIAERFPLPQPSIIEEGVDWRRVRALVVAILEQASELGHALLPASTVITKIRDLPLQPPCPVTQDIMTVVEENFKGSLRVEASPGGKTYQLERLNNIKNVISTYVRKRINANRHFIDADWAKLIDSKLPPRDFTDAKETKAREEKAAALKELAESRFSILVGPAGTGKTTLLSALCNHEEIARGGVLLLAPTGKARVRLAQAIGYESQTIAQFLLRIDRYDENTGAYKVSKQEKYGDSKTVIVDEASMLTEEQLGALIDGLKGVERFILVGDPRQLPPIGTGRPFVDIVTFLKPINVESKFPRVGNAYAELVIARRQIEKDSATLEDTELAAWFSGSSLSPAADEIFDILYKQEKLNRLRLIEWSDPKDLTTKLMETIAEELGLDGLSDSMNFEKSLGGSKNGDYIYFNIDAQESVDRWQILSPLRGYGHGVREINRIIQKTFRQNAIELASNYQKKRIPRPMGPESIVYGDKVINIRNHRRNKIYSKSSEISPLRYVANGEIGIVTGVLRPKFQSWSGPLPLNISFSSQLGYSYVYYPVDFTEESDVPLELAYAITIHRAQGSDFDLVFLILPNPCIILSRELLYTALTRQKTRLVILHQGDLRDLRKYSSDQFSEISRRITNLFCPPDLAEIKNVLYEEKLIHKTKRGEFVRSKSEVIIANLLLENKIEDYSYEKKLVGKDGSERYPDFTISDEDSGVTYYWEHLGMLNDDVYRTKWKSKLEWYAEQGILSFEEGGGQNGVLVTSWDAADGSIDSQDIDKKIKEIIVGE